jgi:hypothetical protein
MSIQSHNYYYKAKIEQATLRKNWRELYFSCK